MLKHKIEKFDVRRFMGLLERSKLARYSSFRYIFLSVVRGRPTVDFCCRAGVFVAQTKSFPSLSRIPSRFYSLQRELPLRHLRDDLSRATASISRLRFTILSNFNSISFAYIPRNTYHRFSHRRKI